MAANMLCVCPMAIGFGFADPVVLNMKVRGVEKGLT